MSKSTRSRREKQGLFSNPTVLAALITGGVGLIVALITSLPQLLPLLSGPTETPIPTITATSQPTSLPTATEALPTETPTQVPPTPTETITPSPTPVDPGIACLDRWQVISSDLELAKTTSRGDCAQADVPDLGISASSAGVSFGKNNFREQGTFGIATSLPSDATVTLQVKFLVLTQGEFWIALSDSPSPEGNMLILALVPNTGEVRFYNDQTSRFSITVSIANCSQTQPCPPLYPIHIKLPLRSAVIGSAQEFTLRTCPRKASTCQNTSSSATTTNRRWVRCRYRSKSAI